MTQKNEGAEHYELTYSWNVLGEAGFIGKVGFIPYLWEIFSNLMG
jgi:hypothetical protein